MAEQVASARSLSAFRSFAKANSSVPKPVVSISLHIVQIQYDRGFSRPYQFVKLVAERRSSCPKARRPFKSTIFNSFLLLLDNHKRHASVMSLLAVLLLLILQAVRRPWNSFEPRALNLASTHSAFTVGPLFNTLQRVTHLLGRLDTSAPSSKDSDMPCEAVASSIGSLTSDSPEARASLSNSRRLSWISRSLSRSSVSKCSIFIPS